MAVETYTFEITAVLFFLSTAATYSTAAATWCVARSDTSDQALQTALDYACDSGADCAPIQSSGLCFLSNTLQAHASYAFNSYYQRKGNAPGACLFAGTAAVARTDPSYGSCVYPSSPSTAGSTVIPGGTPPGATIPGATTSGGIPPIIGTPSPPEAATPLYGNGGGFNPGMAPPFLDSPRTNSSPKTIKLMLANAVLLLSFSYVLQTMCCLGNYSGHDCACEEKTV